MKHTYAGHLQGQRPNGDTPGLKPYLTQIEKFYKRWGNNLPYLNIRQTKPLEGKERVSNLLSDANCGVERDKTADSDLEEMFVGILI